MLNVDNLDLLPLNQSSATFIAVHKTVNDFVENITSQHKTSIAIAFSSCFLIKVAYIKHSNTSQTTDRRQ